MVTAKREIILNLTTQHKLCILQGLIVQRSELDYLIYNDLLGYADLILNGDPEEYLKNVAGGHGLKS